MSFIEKLKNRWGIESTFQIIMILVVFTCTGFTAVYARRLVFHVLGVPPEWPIWAQGLVWIFTILPLYNVLLYIYGVIFGQRVFFTHFLKKMFGRMLPKESDSPKEGHS